MTSDDLTKMIEDELTPEDKARLEKMSPEEQAEFATFIKDHIKAQTEKVNKKAEWLTRLAKEAGAKVEESKGMQFLIGVCAGLIVRCEDIDKQLAEHHEILGPKIAADEFMKKWRERVNATKAAADRLEASKR